MNGRCIDEAGSSPVAHQELRFLRLRLENIYDSISHFRPLTAKPPILDSSLDLESSEDGQWLQQEIVPGIKKLKDAVKMDLDVLEKFLEGPGSENLPPLSTNAPYLIAVWNEVLCAPLPIVSVFRSFSLTPVDPSVDPRKRVTQKPPGAKVDVVADNGRRWIRVNTVKNSRMLSEFREIDSYLTDSGDDSDCTSEGGQPTLAQTEFDNSVLRMGRILLVAAKANPVEGTTEIPQITLRLTRLDISPTSDSGEENDLRIAQTVQLLRDMGIDVELGERENVKMPAPEAPSPLPSGPLTPTTRVNLDLSVLIALVSDLTHAPLPTTVHEAKARFVPPQRYREWKQQRVSINSLGKHKDRDEDKDKNDKSKGKGKGKERLKDSGSSGGIDTDSGEIPNDLAKHSRALTNQVLQEMGKGLLQEIYDKISSASPPGLPPSAPKVEFWTTPEARDRCLRIISKIGGVNERRRTHALFPDSSLSSEVLSTPAQAEEAYWRGSRYPLAFLPLLPILIYSSSTPSPENQPQTQPPHLPLFFKSLSKTCKDILAQETMPHPRALPEEIEKTLNEIQRATVTKANPRLTAHTVQSMLWGAELGWTTLTANKTSVKAILREMKAAKIAGRLDGEVEDAGGEGEREEAVEKASIWIVDPRSLAEGMRADYEH